MARERYEDDDFDDDRPRRRRRDDDEYDDDGYDDDRPRGEPPSNFLVPSILVTICCCLIGGVVAIVYAAQVNSKWEARDYAGARQAAANAKLWCWLSFGIGIVTNAAVVALQIWVEMEMRRGQ